MATHKVSLAIYKPDGITQVRSLLVGKELEPGRHTFTWDGLNRYGEPLPPGSYQWKAISSPGLEAKFVTMLGVNPETIPIDWAGSQEPASAVAVNRQGEIAIGAAVAEGTNNRVQVTPDYSEIIWSRQDGAFTEGDVQFQSMGDLLLSISQNGDIHLTNFTTGQRLSSFNVLWPGDEAPNAHGRRYQRIGATWRSLGTVIYRNTFDAAGNNVGLGSDPIDPLLLFPHKGVTQGDGQTTIQSFDNATDSNRSGAIASGSHLHIDIPKGSVLTWASGLHLQTDNRFRVLSDAMNALTPGEYSVSFQIDYSSTLQSTNFSHPFNQPYIRLSLVSLSNRDFAGGQQYLYPVLALNQTATNGATFASINYTMDFEVAADGPDARGGKTFTQGQLNGLHIDLVMDGRVEPEDETIRFDNLTLYSPQPRSIKDTVVVAYEARNTLQWRDIFTGTQRLEVTGVPEPIDVTMLPGGCALVISQGAVLRVAPHGTGNFAVSTAEGCCPATSGSTVVETIIEASNLQNPTRLAFDIENKEILIAQGDPSHQILRFSLTGNLLKTYGKAGGRDYGSFVPENFRSITSLTADGSGGIIGGEFTKEGGTTPRVFHIDNNGVLLKQWFGGAPFFDHAALDPDDPSLAYVTNYGGLTVQQVNLETGETAVTAEYLHKGLNGIFADPQQWENPWELMRRNGELYLYHDGAVLSAASDNASLFRIDTINGSLVPVATAGRVYRASAVWREAMTNAGLNPDNDSDIFAWSDVNGTGQIMSDGFILGGIELGADGQIGGHIDSNWNLYFGSRDLTVTANLSNAIVKIENTGTPDGAPVWNLNNPVSLPSPIPAAIQYEERPVVVDVYLDDNQDAYALFEANTYPDQDRHGLRWPTGGRGVNQILKWDKDGNILWAVGRHAVVAPLETPTPPGQFHEFIKIAAETDNEIFVLDRAGSKNMQAWTKDGLYLGAIDDKINYSGVSENYFRYLLFGDDQFGSNVQVTSAQKVFWLPGGRNATYFFEITGLANVVRASKQVTLTEETPSATATGTGLSGKYYAGSDTSVSPLISRLDDRIWFDWEDGAPDPRLNINDFSVVWEGWLEAPITDNYWISIYGESGGGSVQLDGTEVVVGNNFGSVFLTFFQPVYPQAISNPIPLKAGDRYSIRVSYTHNISGPASFSLNWETLTMDRQRIPTRYLYES